MFDVSDRSGAPKVLIINRSQARELFPNGEAVGRRLTVAVGTNSLTFEGTNGTIAGARSLQPLKMHACLI